MGSIFSCWVACCCALELEKPPDVFGPVTPLGRADEQLLILRLGIWPNGRVGPKNFGKIRPGMTEGDVAKVLGEPNSTTDLSKSHNIKVVPADKGTRHFRVMKIN